MENYSAVDMAERLAVMEFIVTQTLSMALQSHPQQAQLLTRLESQLVERLSSSAFADRPASSMAKRILKNAKAALA